MEPNVTNPPASLATGTEQTPPVVKPIEVDLSQLRAAQAPTQQPTTQQPPSVVKPIEVDLNELRAKAGQSSFQQPLQPMTTPTGAAGGVPPTTQVTSRAGAPAMQPPPPTLSQSPTGRQPTATQGATEQAATPPKLLTPEEQTRQFGELMSPSTRAVTAQFDEAAFRESAKEYANAASSLKSWEEKYNNWKKLNGIDLAPSTRFSSYTDEQLASEFTPANKYSKEYWAEAQAELSRRAKIKNPKNQDAIKNFESVINAFRDKEKSDIQRASKLIDGDLDKLVPRSEDLAKYRESAKPYTTRESSMLGLDVPDPFKIGEISKARAKELGLEGTAFEKLYYGLLASRVDEALVLDYVVSDYKKKSASIYKKYGITPESDDRIIAEGKTKIESIDDAYIASSNELRRQIQSEFAPYAQKYQSSAAGIELSYKQAVDRIQQDLNNGLVDEATANARLQKVNQNIQSYANQREAEAKSIEERILAAYSERFTTLRKDYMSNRALAVASYERKFGDLQKKVKDPKLAKELEDAFRQSYNNVLEQRQKARVEFSRPGSAMLNSFMKTTGSMIKGLASLYGYGVGPVYQFGDYLDRGIAVPEVDISSFKSWIPGQGLETLIGSTAASMTPTILGGVATAPVGGWGGVAVGGVVNFAINAAQMVGSARDQRFQATGSEYEADKAGMETLKSQAAYLPLSFIESLPFVKGFTGIARRIPAKLARFERPVQATLKGAVELGAETVQEMAEGSTEQSVLQGGGAFDQLGQDLLDANKWKETFISIGPSGFIGAAGAWSDPTRRGLANEFLAQRAADRLGNSYQDAWVVKNAFADPVMAKASIDLMFANGNIDQDMRAKLTQKLDATVANIGKADKLGLGGQRKYVYASMATALDDLKAKANVESDPVTKQVLEDRIKVATKGLVDFANNKGGSYFMITMSNDVPMVQTEEGMAGLLADSEFVDGAINASNINIQAFGKTSPEVQKSLKDIFDKRKQLKAQQDAVQERTATQVGAQPGGAEGAGQAGGEGMGPGVQGTQAAQAVNPQERLNEVRQRITQIEEARDQGLTLEGMQPGELANLKNEEQQLMDAIATGPVRPGQAPSPSLATEPQTRTTALFEQLDRMRGSMAGMKRKERRDTQKRLNQMLTQDARLAEVDAKFASMAADLERQGKLKRRCP